MTTLAEVRESIEVLRRIEDSWPYPYEVFEQHVERLRTWLDAQAEAPTERWEPVADMSAEEFRNPDAWLAGNICICRRVEVQP